MRASDVWRRTGGPPETRSYTRRHGPSDNPRPAPRYGGAMKVILWIIAILFFIGLAVVLGLGSLIF